MTPETSTPLICLAGPTAAGKSAAAAAIAARWPVEIINVDSATIYRTMDIGTAKPTRDERAQIPHHLVDIRDPSQTYSAAAFRRDALECVAAIRARGHLPLLAGGTMLYFKALRDGLNDLPQADAGVRREIEVAAQARGWPAIHEELARIDPVTAARLAPNDSQRIGRALEIWRLTGQPMSGLIQSAVRTDIPVPTVTISLEPAERGVLHARIAARFDQMLEQGLVDEVGALYARGDLTPELPSIRCVGYRQLWRYVAGEQSLPQAREQAIAATRQLAKRQLTWLRALPDRISIDALAENAASLVIDRIAQLVASWSMRSGT